MNPPLRIGVAGGSIGGLTTAVLLHELGEDVQVFERSPSALEGRGAGIVVLPITERYFVERGGGLGSSDREASDVALTLTNWSYIDRAGTIIDASPTYNRFTAWNTLYRALLDALPQDRYQLGHQVERVEQGGDDEEPVRVSFTNGDEYSCDLLIGADGMGSTVREIVSPETTTVYAGYVAYRGTILERDLHESTAEILDDAMVYQVLDDSHILAYAIPGPDDSIERGERAVNFVWYRNVEGTDFDDLMTDRHGDVRPTTMPPGLLQDRFVDELHKAARTGLAPQLRELVLGCVEPFIQAIFDMAAERFVHDRIVLLGDAATVMRPHVAAGTAKACADAWALRDHLRDRGIDDVGLRAALSAWEAQQLGVARSAAERSRSMGEAAQTLGTMTPGDPSWRFGLFGPGN
jgi:2,6-dihydroxypyridine 3-monooxygenase